MAPSTFSLEIECKVPAKRMWRAAYECAPQCLPKALPDFIEAVHYSPTLSPGCIGTLVFTEDYAKHIKEKLQAEVSLRKDRFEEVDPHAFKVKCVVIEGGFLAVGFFKSYRHTVQFKETGAETCVVHYSAEYEPIHDEHKHQFPEFVKGALVKMYKAVEAYLLSHNDFQ